MSIKSPDFNTPVALLFFNRPDKTSKVFEVISKIRPSVLLLVSDGPRPDRHEEASLVNQAREVVSKITWPCKVLKNYSDSNLGCKKRVSSGLDWVFSEVDRAIILEDDCLPSPTFFWYCHELLDLYKANDRIGMISGVNLLSNKLNYSASYFFTEFVHIWGWATWSNRWKSYDVDMNGWPSVADGDVSLNIMNSTRGRKYWGRIFESVYAGKIDTWDYQWLFANQLSKRINITPSVNLVSNMGFDDSATHTIQKTSLSNMPLGKLELPLSHPGSIEVNIKLDQILSDQMYTIPAMLGYKRVKSFFKRLFNKLLAR